MKLTPSQLRQIIKEEVSSITEARADNRPWAIATITTNVARAGKTTPARIVARDDMTKARKDIPIRGRGSRSDAGDFETHLQLASELAREQGYKGVMVFTGADSMMKAGEYVFAIYSMDAVVKL